jgi:hypothetical protein
MDKLLREAVQAGSVERPWVRFKALMIAFVVACCDKSVMLISTAGFGLDSSVGWKTVPIRPLPSPSSGRVAQHRR